MDSCVARQPIFDDKLRIYGYELLFRSTSASVGFDGIDGSTATSETIVNSFHEIGIERVTGGKRAFVNFTEKLLLQGVATILPNRILVVEVLENVEPTQEIIKACERLRGGGYLVALDDFILDPKYFPLIAVADIIKVDFMSTPIDKIATFAKGMSRKPVILLAEKLETQETFEKAKELGFKLFQGYFFSKPVIVENAEPKLTPSKVNSLRLIRLSNDINVDFSKIAAIIKQDVALSYRLLRVVNSAFFGLKYTVKNIRQALAILGMDEVKKWITLISLAVVADSKPDELVTMSLTRARMMEYFAPLVGMAKQSDDMFMVGLLSLMDALMDLPIEEIAKRTNIAEHITAPLITGEGLYADILSIITLFERSEWDECFKKAEPYNLDPDQISKTYIEAIEWSSTLGR